MSMMINLEAPVNNDSAFQIQVTQNTAPFNAPFLTNTAPLNLTGYTLKLYVKASNTASDSGATIYTVGLGLTMVNTALGQFTFVLPHTNATTPGTQWWRLDVIDANGNVGTALYGNLFILAV